MMKSQEVLLGLGFEIETEVVILSSVKRQKTQPETGDRSGR
jgi:hypothetical protein